MVLFNAVTQELLFYTYGSNKKMKAQGMEGIYT